MPLSQALRKLTEAGLLTALTPRPLPQPIPAQFRMDLHCAYHQGPGHETDRCTALRHAIQDLIDQGLVHLGQPSVTTNPLPTHTTHAVPPPAGGIHFLDFDETDDHVHMLSWDDPDPEPIMPAGFTRRAATSEPLTFTRYSVQAPYILIPDVEEVRAPHVDISQTPDIQYILRGGRVMRQPPPAAARPVEGTSASQEEVRAEDDEILRQLQSTQARISIWSLLASSSTHRDALTRALSQIRVDTTTTPEGLIHMMTAGRATCIAPSPSVLLDNGSALNVCPLATAIALGYAPSDFGPSTQTVASYDSTRREVMGTLEIELLIGPATFVAVFQVLRIPTSFNLLLADRGSIELEPFLLHFIRSHSDDDLLLTGFTFDEVQTLELGDFCGTSSLCPLTSMGAQWCSILCGACPIYPAWGWVDVSMDRASYHHFLIMTTQHHRRPSFSASSQLQLSDGAWPFGFCVDCSSSPDRTSLMTLCFPDEIDDHGTFAEIGDVVDGAVPRDEYVDEMLAMSLSQTEEMPAGARFTI
ncbi:hypothetical protein CK203_010754 [Vitis vinifera]|uniref:Uncharacterized protein n=1 Tax=Vitis vinifera TaxID=29760 RepID=A0A438JTB4_VITVI|nr:hypothetical protein CK203_010754 [Vitis vinifera]